MNSHEQKAPQKAHMLQKLQNYSGLMKNILSFLFLEEQLNALSVDKRMSETDEQALRFKPDSSFENVIIIYDPLQMYVYLEALKQHYYKNYFELLHSSEKLFTVLDKELLKIASKNKEEKVSQVQKDEKQERQEVDVRLTDEEEKPTVKKVSVAFGEEFYKALGKPKVIDAWSSKETVYTPNQMQFLTQSPSFRFEYSLTDLLLLNDAQDTPLYVHVIKNNLDVLDYYFQQIQKPENLTAELKFNHLHALSSRVHTGFTYLHLAIICRQKKIVEEILSRPCDPNKYCTLNGRQRTPLLLAAETGQTDVAQLLIDNGANMDLQDEKQRVALHLALISGCTVAMIDLFKSQVNTTTQHTLEPFDKKVVSPLFLASAYGNVAQVAKLLEHKADIKFTFKVNDGVYNALDIALAANKFDVARFLIKSGCEAIPAHGNSLLHIEAGKGNLEKVKLLAENISVNTLNNWNDTPLHLAAKAGGLAVVKFLIECKADINLKNQDGDTPLDLAVKAKKHQCAKCLIMAGAERNIADYRVHSLDFEMMDLLIETKSDTELQDKLSLDLLCQALKSREMNLIKHILKKIKNLNVCHQYNGSEVVPLALAVRYSSSEVVDLLIKQGADVNFLDANGNSLLINTVAERHLGAVKKLIQHGAGVNYPGVTGSEEKKPQTPLRIAVKNCFSEVCAVLLEHEAKFSLEEKQTENPLFVMQGQGKAYANTAKLLIQHGADFKETQNDVTLLMLAIKNNSNELVEYLLDNGAKFGKTELDLIFEFKRVEIFKTVLQRGLVSDLDNLFMQAPTPELKRCVLHRQLDVLIQKIKPHAKDDSHPAESKAEQFAKAVQPLGKLFHELKQFTHKEIAQAEQLLNLLATDLPSVEDLEQMKTVFPKGSELLDIYENALMVTVAMQYQKPVASLTT